MPKIVEQKQKIRDKGLKASAGLNRVNREKAIKKADFKLAETTEENTAPLMPQLSAKSATLNRQALNAQPTSINRIITKKPDQPRLK